ncbi:MAG TPA: hypothetical protein VF807_07750 [Ktedonobacterales bacterium]
MFQLDATTITLGIAIVQTIFLVLAGFAAYFQFRETAKTRYLEAVVRMFEDFGSHEAYHHADLVLGLPPRIEAFSPDELTLATWVVRVYEEIGFLVESEMIPAAYLVPLYSRRIVWSWQALRPFVERQRELQRTGGAYRMSGDGRYFEKLYHRALAYRKGQRRKEQVEPPIPEDYRQQLAQAIARGERIVPDGDTPMALGRAH